MSSSFRNSRHIAASTRSTHCRSASGLAVVLALYGCAIHAADKYFVPSAEVSAESHSNREMNTKAEGENSSIAYFGDVAAIFGIATPRSDTYLRPRVRLQDDSERDDAKRTEQFLDFKSAFKSERDQFDFLARYSKRDTLNAEFEDTQFDPTDPTDPTVPETGRIVVGETTTNISVRPSYRRQWTQRMGSGLGAEYRTTEFDGGDPIDPKVGFDFWRGEAFLSRVLGLRTNAELGAYVTKFESDDDLNTTDGYGGLLRLTREWTPTIGGDIQVFVERSDIERRPSALAPVVEESSTDWGLLVSGYRKGPAGQLRFIAGRAISPSNSGAKTTVDQARIQYEREVTQRLIWTTAVRYDRQRAIGDSISDADRDSAAGELELRYLLTPTWYVTGGYGYLWQDRKLEADDARNHRFMLGFGYQGLRQRR